MISRREFEDAIRQINKIFHAMEDDINDLKKEVEALKKPKASPRKKTLDKSE